MSDQKSAWPDIMSDHFKIIIIVPVHVYKHTKWMTNTDRRTYEMSSSRSDEFTSSALAMATTPSLLKPLFEMLNTFNI